jgi:chaperonin cofactor prefoldin
MSRAKIQEIPDEEEELEEMDEDDMDEGMDMFEALGSLLATEEGETIATTLVGLKDATERIAQCMEMQNKILVKILSSLSAAKPCMCPAPAVAPEESA